MVRDLDFPVQVVGVPTVREPDGLAVSSRNTYLTPTDRVAALALSAALLAVAARVGTTRLIDNVPLLIGPGGGQVDAFGSLPVTAAEK
jgi:pantothenate synthetase